MTERVIWGGRYAIFGEIATGGMATVYLAARLGDGSNVPPVVALKKLSAELAKQPEFVAMFLDEAHLAARIRHPNVVTTYEFLRTGEGLGIVMDLVVGESFVVLLRGTAEELDRIPVPISAAVLVGALEGLHAAHEATDDTGRSLGLVHRDISPHNIIVGGDGIARVIDFGIAKAAGRLQMTDVGVIKGKFAYMSPEQIQGLAVDRATDIYAAGIVLWEALAGRKLFRATSNEELLTKRSAGTLSIPPPSSMRSEVPPELEKAVLRALEPDPRRRFPTAAAMAAAIRAACDIADQSAVAVWVRERAGERLSMLEAGRREILASMSDTLCEPSAAPSRPRVAPVVDIPDAAGAVPGLQSTKPSVQSSRPAPPNDAARRPGFSEDLVFADAGNRAASAPIELAPPLASLRPSASPPGVDGFPSPYPAPRVRPPIRARRSSRGRVALLALVVLGVLGVSFSLRLPALLRSHAIASAAAHGVVLALDRAEPTRSGLKLTGAKVTLAGCPDVTLSAGEVRVDLGGLGDIRRVTLDGYELTVRGAAGDAASELRAWWKAQHAPLTVEGKAGHLVWTSPVFPGVAVEALDVSLAVAPPPSAAMTLDTSSLLITLPRGHVGPWQAHLDAAPLEIRVRVGFDPASAGAPPSATYIERERDGATWSIDIPRASTFKIGVPGDLLGLTLDLAVEVDAHARLGPTGSPLTADARVGLYGLETAGHAATVDLVVAGTVSGDPKTLLPLQGGRLAVGKVSSPVSGTLALSTEGLRVEIDRPSARTGTPGPQAGTALVLDTRAWTGGAPPDRSDKTGRLDKTRQTNGAR